MSDCGASQNVVDRRLIVSRSTKMQLFRRVNVTGLFSIEYGEYDMIIMYVNATYVTVMWRHTRYIS